MPTTHTVTSGSPTTIVSAGASPVSVSIPPHAEPLVITITSAAAITITAQSTTRPLDIQHTP